MKIIDVLIVDDEAPAREVIRHYLQDHSRLRIVGEATNGFDAIMMIRELRPQLLFLDIQMPKLTGFEMLELIEETPEIIFSTAYDQYAIRAFEMSVVDYLLKPYSKARFETAVQKAVVRIDSDKGDKRQIEELKEHINQSLEVLNRIAVKDRQQIHIIPVREIDHIEADGDYVWLHTPKGLFLKEKTMKYFEEHLHQHFVRIHRSYIVNVDQVAKIELYEKESYRVWLKNGTVLKASINGYKRLKEMVRL
ncbi:MAG: LytTR family transcriptional regulator DNA-binding domain-containing protein [Prevotellaceae bacterium]|jgi:two-component system LytT family response regulator|nr:LytTR family transcriptional regulator DNA-binding domain-containing protein [Prevotellaceae bacterium]